MLHSNPSLMRRIFHIAASLAVMQCFAATCPAEDVPRITLATKRFGSLQIMTIGIDGSNPVQVTHETEDAAQPNWSPDGSKLAYLVGPIKQGKVKVCDADGGNAHLLFEGEGPQKSPCWSPDGKQILFSMASTTTGAKHLFVINADGTELKNLTSELTYAACPAWSPDRTKIAFSSQRPRGRLGLFLMNADGTNPIDLSGQDMYGYIYPCWSPDGKQIVYGYSERQQDCELRQINVDGTGDAILVGGSMPHSFAAWSHDGRYLAYAGGPVSNGADLSLYDVVTGEHKVILHNEIFEVPNQDGPPSWVPVRAKQ